MTDQRVALEERVEQLAGEVQSLARLVDLLLTRQGLAGVQSVPVLPQLPPGDAPREEERSAAQPVEVTEELLSWAGKASLLPRVATLCFLLVIALILRTITDNGLINTLVGSALGMGYATVLMVTGWYKYRQESPLAPVFAACGAVLISTIVVETHSHFQSLPLVPAYVTLMLTGIGMAFVSYRHNAFTPISVGTLSMCLAGAALDYPNPFFPYLAMVLLTANVLGFFAARLQRCAWLRWIVLVVTLVMLHMWALKLGLTLRGRQQFPVALAPEWYIPVLLILSVAYLGIALSGILRSGSERISRFDFSLPTINVIWTFVAAWYVIAAGGKSEVMLGAAGIVAAAAHLGLAFWLADRRVHGSPGTNSFACAGVALLALSLPAAVGGVLHSLPAVAAVALLVGWLSGAWRNDAVRLTSYALQLYVGGALLFTLSATGAAALDRMSAIPAGISAGLALVHYLWSRKFTPLGETNVFFARFDRRDLSAVALFLVSLLGGFFVLRIGVYHVLGGAEAPMKGAFSAAQSVIINGAAIVLMLLALIRRNKELRNVAIFVTLLGGIKVFFSDLFGMHGVPLVVSVFSFGVAAALESVVLGRWQKLMAGAEKSPLEESRQGI